MASVQSRSFETIEMSEELLLCRITYYVHKYLWNAKLTTYHLIGNMELWIDMLAGKIQSRHVK